MRVIAALRAGGGGFVGEVFAMDSLKLRCSNCARMIAVELVDQHTRLCAAPPPPSPALVAYPSDFEDQMRHLFGSPAKLLMESLPESGSSPVDVGPADSLYRLSLPTGVHAGWVAKRGAGRTERAGRAKGGPSLVQTSTSTKAARATQSLASSRAFAAAFWSVPSLSSATSRRWQRQRARLSPVRATWSF